MTHGEFVEFLINEHPTEIEATASQIAKLAMMQVDPSEALKPPVHTLGEYLDIEIAVPPVLVEPRLVVRGEITVNIARAGKGKTTFGLNRFFRWCAGRPLFDDLPDVMKPVKPLKVLMIENEGSAGLFQDRCRTMLAAHTEYNEEEIAEIKRNLLVWGEGGWSGLKIDNESDVQMIERALEEHKPDILFLEPFRGIWRGQENDASEMEGVLDKLIEIGTHHDAAIMLTHHERKSGAGEDGEQMSAARGSAAFEGKAAIMERFSGVKGGDMREVVWIKNRFAPAPAPVRMQFNPVTWRYEHVTETDLRREIAATIQDNVGQWLSVADISELLGENATRIRKEIKAMVEDKVLKYRASEPKPGGGTTGPRYALRSDDDDADRLAVS